MKLLTIRNRATRRIAATYIIPNDMVISDWAYKKAEVYDHVMEKTELPIPQVNCSRELEDELHELFK